MPVFLLIFQILSAVATIPKIIEGFKALRDMIRKIKDPAKKKAFKRQAMDLAVKHNARKHKEKGGEVGFCSADGECETEVESLLAQVKAVVDAQG